MPATLAGVFLGLLFGRGTRITGDTDLDTEQLVDLLMHGAVEP